MGVAPATDALCDVLVVSVAGTIGWTAGARELTAALGRAGVHVVAVQAPRPRDVRTFMLTDLMEASAARKATLLALAEHRPEAVIYCSTTSALLWPRPGAVWLDATAAVNRPGRHGLWQRRLERRRLRAAPLVLGWSPGAAAGAPPGLAGDPVVVPVPVEPSGPLDGERDLAAVAYAADPSKRRLQLTLDAWRRARREDETLVVCGLVGEDEPAAGVRYAGRVDADAFRALLRRARMFLAAPRQEEYGIAALEALADGAQLVTTPVAIGAYPALDLAHELDPRLVAGPADGAGAAGAAQLADAIRAALDAPLPDYAARAAQLIAPYRRDAVTEVLRRDVLPVLLPGWRG